jgi:hypothetical protein
MKNKFECNCSLCGRRVAIGEGDTNMIEGKWKTQHVNARCPVTHQSNFGSPAYGSGYGARDSWRDYYEDDDNPYGPFSTSEDVNPNEGSK